MAMLTQSLTVGVWYQFTKLDYPYEMVVFEVTTASPCIIAVDTVTPGSGSVGYNASQGMNAVQLAGGKNCYIKLVSGAASVTYSQFDGLSCDPAKCGYARSDGAAINEWVPSADMIAGFADSPTPDQTYAAYFTTLAAGLASGATITTAYLTLTLAGFLFGRSFTVKAYKYNVDKSTTFTNYTTMHTTLTYTTATASFTVDSTGKAVIDVKAIIQELVAIGGWTTSSPIQFNIADSGSHSGTTDKLITISRVPTTSVLIT